MVHIEQAVIVEGKYDKIHLSQFLDAVIIAVGGFGVFKDKDTQQLIRHYAQTVGIVIMTDSDSAGMLIRGRIKSIAAGGRIYNAYVPEILGKEKRKQSPSKEGKLGVEGIEPQAILEALGRCGITPCERKESGVRVSMQDLIADGLSGGKNSSQKRQRLLSELGLPQSLGTKAMLEVINSMISAEEYRELVVKICG